MDKVCLCAVFAFITLLLHNVHDVLSAPASPGQIVRAITATVKEETAIGTVILNLTSALGVQSRARNDSVNVSKWRLFNSGASLFDIDATGALVVRNRIDLESFCQQFSVCCPYQRAAQNECTLNLLLHQDQGQLTPLHVVVQDVNEFVPQFAQSSINISIYENSVEQMIRVPMPKDEDASSSKFVTLHISYPDTDPNGQNFIAQSAFNKPIDTTASTEIRLPLADKGSSGRFELDRERKDTYRFRILACELNSTTRCGNATVTLSVLDVNDNAPRFARNEYEFSVAENASTNVALFRVSATDVDQNENGELYYSIEAGSIKCVTPGSPMCKSSSEDDFPDGEALFIVLDDGSIMLNRMANYENCTLWTFRVQATDSGTPPRAGFADVKVRVLDVDDTKPCLRMEPHSETVEVEEGETRSFGRLPHVIVVNDPDTPKANVQCRSELAVVQLTEMFVTNNPHEKTYQIVPTRAFDREAEDDYQIRLECSDRNFTDDYTEPLVFSLKVTDINDNPPAFPSHNISATLRENSPPGAVITTLLAADRDSGTNAHVQYELLHPSLFISVEQDGTVRSKQTIDREQLQRVEAIVVARDSGSPRLSTNATLTVLIADENDCAPKFERDSYQFNIQEDTPPSNSYPVGHVKATDADTDGTLTYSLINGTEHFLIATQTGSIFLQKAIDREQFQHYTFIVAVSDADLNAHTTTVPVHVSIADVNDNAPRMIFPSKTNYTIKVQCPRDSHPNGYNIYQANAVDDDATAEHRQVEYRLEILNPSNASSNTFRIDASTGEIFYMLSSCITSYSLKVMAVDANNDSLRSEQVLQVLFVLFDPTDSGKSEWDTRGRNPDANDPRNANTKTNQAVQSSGLNSHQLMIVLATTLVVLFIAFMILLLIFVKVSKRGGASQKERRKTNETYSENARSGAHMRVRSERVNQEEDAASGNDAADRQDMTYSDQEERCEPIYEDSEFNDSYANNDKLCESPVRELKRSDASRSGCNSPLNSHGNFKLASVFPVADSNGNQYCESLAPSTRWCAATVNVVGNRSTTADSASPASTHRLFSVAPAPCFSTMRNHSLAMQSATLSPALRHQTLQCKAQQPHSWLQSALPHRCVPNGNEQASHYDSSTAAQTMAFQNAMSNVPSVHSSVLSNSVRNGAMEYKVVPTTMMRTPQRSLHCDRNSFV